MRVEYSVILLSALLVPLSARADDEAMAAEYAYCAGVTHVMASSASFGSLDPYIKRDEAEALRASAKKYARMQSDFLQAALNSSNKEFVAREPPNVTRKLNALRLREVDLNNALLKQAAEKCSKLWTGKALYSS